MPPAHMKEGMRSRLASQLVTVLQSVASREVSTRRWCSSVTRIRRRQYPNVLPESVELEGTLAHPQQ